MGAEGLCQWFLLWIDNWVQVNTARSERIYVIQSVRKWEKSWKFSTSYDLHPSASFFFFFRDLFFSLEPFLPSPSVFFFFGDGLWASSDDDEEDDEWDDEEAEELLLLLDEELDLLFLCESLSLLFTKFSSWLRLKSISVSSDGRESSKSAPERDILMV